MSISASSQGQTHEGEVPLAERTPLAPDELERMNAYWRAANYLCVGQIAAGPWRQAAAPRRARLWCGATPRR